MSYDIKNQLSRVLEVVGRRRNNPELQANIEAVLEQVNRITTAEGAMVDDDGKFVRDAVERMTTKLEALDWRLRELRRQASIGAPA